MRQFVVSEAPASRVAQHVREVVEEAGGIVAHHTSRKTEFDHLDYGEQAWRRAGYVGTYQRFKEKPVQVRIRVWAQWPRRLLTGTIYVGFALALLFFALSIVEAAIPPNVWIFTALPLLGVIAAGLLMYTSSMADSKGAEERIEALLVDRLREDEQIVGEIYDVEDWEAYREQVIDEAREEARQRAPHGGSRVKKAAAGLKGSLTGLTSSEEPADEPVEEPGSEEQEEPGLAANLKAKLGRGEEAGADGDEPEDEPLEKIDGEEPDEVDDGPGLVANLKAKLGMGEEEADDGDEDEPGQQTDDEEAEPEAADEEPATDADEAAEADAQPGTGRA